MGYSNSKSVSTYVFGIPTNLYSVHGNIKVTQCQVGREENRRVRTRGEEKTPRVASLSQCLELMPTSRIPYSFASQRRRTSSGRLFSARTSTAPGASCHSYWKLPDGLELPREPFWWSTYVISVISQYFVSVPS